MFTALHQWTFHGGRIDQASRAFPDAPAPWIDLSTGINPFSWDAGRVGMIDWRALPAPSALNALETAAADYYGVAPERICAVPGSEAGLRLIATLGLPGPYRHVAPGYRTHAEIFAESRPIRWADLPEAAAGGGTVAFANPGNPDGHLLDMAVLERLVAAARSSGGWLVVDEAFADVVPDFSLLPRLAADAPVVVSRSFGKFFGLAGLRLGFVVAPAGIIAAIRKSLGSWPVSNAAMAIGTEALGDKAWIADARVRIAGSAAALDAVLRRHNLDPVGRCPLFRLVETADAGRLFDRLARRGILTRPFDHDPRWLRIGLPDGETVLARLDQALGDG